MIEEAKTFARTYHKGQRYGAADYFTAHLSAVAALAAEATDDNEIIAAAWLHDVIEDTGATADQLLAIFSPRVKFLVECVTDDPGRNRKERKARSIEKISRDRAAVLVKLCDRLANMEASAKDNPGLLKMYQRELPDFTSGLRREGEYDQLWSRLLAFAPQTPPPPPSGPPA